MIMFTRMKSIIKILLAGALAMVFSGVAVAQAPIAGSGELPGIDPLARPSKPVLDAIEKIMSDRRDRGPFLLIRTCFREAGIQQALVRICRQRLERYHNELLIDERETLANQPPMEIYARLVELAEDPDARATVSDIFALRGIATTVDQFREFQDVKECFRTSGPQPAFRQVCRQQLDRLYNELRRNLSPEMRDVRPEMVQRRLLQLADANQSPVASGDTTAFDSLRNIRKQQQEEAARARAAMSVAGRYYCPAPPSPPAPALETELSDPGICLCSYGRRYIASNPLQSGRPLFARYAQCGAAGHFRVRDLNGGTLNHGDWITLQAAHGGYVSMNARGAVTADKSNAGKYESFRVMRAANVPGRIQAGEMVTLISPRGMFVTPGGDRSAVLHGTKEQLQPFEFIVLVPN